MFACTFVITGTGTWAMYGLYMYFFTLNFREQVQSQPKSAPDQAQKNQEVQFYMRCKSFWEYWERERERVENPYSIYINFFFSQQSQKQRKLKVTWQGRNWKGIWNPDNIHSRLRKLQPCYQWKYSAMTIPIQTGLYSKYVWLIAFWRQWN